MVCLHTIRKVFFFFKYKGISPFFWEVTDTGAIVFGRLISLFWTYDDATLKVESKIILWLISMVLYYFTVVDQLVFHDKQICEICQT